jgi:WD domain, G-beta repeat
MPALKWWSDSPRLARFVRGLTRVCLFLAALWFVNDLGDHPWSKTSPPWSSQWPHISACNRGRPFFLYVGPPTDPETNPSMFTPYLDQYGDYGVPFLTSVVWKFQHAFLDRNYHVGDDISDKVICTLLVLTALLFVLPAVPLPTSVGATTALYLLLSLNPGVTIADMGWMSGRSWGGVTVIQCAVFLVVALRQHKGVTGWITLTSLGLLIAYSPLLRQSTSSTPVALCAGLLVAGVVPVLVILPQVRKHRRVVKRVVLFCAGVLPPALLLLGELVLVRVGLQAACARLYHVPFQTVRLPGHGSGFPLWMSLGQVSNPYNSCWKDEVAEVHVFLASGKPYAYGMETQDRLRAEWLRLVRESPFLLVRNMAANGWFLHKALLDRLNFRDEERRTMAPTSCTNPWIKIIYIAAAVCLLLFTGLVVVFKRFDLFSFAFGAILCLLGANLGALVVYPGYLADTYGSLIATVCILLPASLQIALPGSRQTKVPNRIERRLVSVALCLVVALSVLGMLAGGGWMAYCNSRNAAVANNLAQVDPLAGIQEWGYRYAHFFNLMPVEKQAAVLDALKNSGSPQVYVLRQTSGEQAVYTPLLAILGDKQVHLISRFGQGWTPPEVYMQQGFTSSYVQLVRDEAVPLGETPLLYDVNLSLFHRINDHFWDGKYRMLTFPCGPEFRHARSLHAGGFKIVGVDKNGWILEPITTGTLFPAFRALTVSGQPHEATCVSCSPDGNRLASAGQDHAIRVWDTLQATSSAAGKDLFTLRGHTDWVACLCFSPDGKRLASGSADHTVKVWDLSTGQVLLTLDGHCGSIHCISFSPDGKRLAAGSADQIVKIWDLATGQILLTLKGQATGTHFLLYSPPCQRLAGGFRAVRFSPDGNHLACICPDRTIQVYDATSGQAGHTLKGHTRDVVSIRFSPDGRLLKSESCDSTVKVWDWRTGQEILGIVSGWPGDAAGLSAGAPRW